MATHDGRFLRIVILNDSPRLLQTLSSWFQSHGHAVAAVEIGHMRDFFKAIRRIVDTHTPNVLVFDVAMPYASSYDLASLLHHHVPNCPIVLTTPNKSALTEAVGANEALEIRGNPADLEALLEKVQGAAHP